jgi:hypothetical protein
MVSFEDSSLGSASNELRGLGMEFALDMLAHCQRVEASQIDFRTLAIFATYHGVEMFQAKIAGKFIIYAVELDRTNDLKVTIMFAGEHGVSATAGTFSWDGQSYAALASSIIQARAAVWFT